MPMTGVREAVPQRPAEMEETAPLLGSTSKFYTAQSALLQSNADTTPTPTPPHNPHLDAEPTFQPPSLLQRLAEHKADLTAVSLVYMVEGILDMASLAVSYMLKDTLLLSPGMAGLAQTLGQIPWEATPILALVSDTVPLFGYQRKGYLMAVGIFGSLCWALLAALCGASTPVGTPLATAVPAAVSTFKAAGASAAAAVAAVASSGIPVSSLTVVGGTVTNVAPLLLGSRRRRLMGVLLTTPLLAHMLSGSPLIGNSFDVDMLDSHGVGAASGGAGGQLGGNDGWMPGLNMQMRRCLALVTIVLSSACTAWTQVIADAVIVKLSQGQDQQVASFYQALSWMTYTGGALLSAYTTGAILAASGPRNVFLLAAAGLLLDGLCAVLLRESRRLPVSRHVAASLPLTATATAAVSAAPSPDQDLAKVSRGGAGLSQSPSPCDWPYSPTVVKADAGKVHRQLRPPQLHLEEDIEQGYGQEADPLLPTSSTAAQPPHSVCAVPTTAASTGGGSADTSPQGKPRSLSLWQASLTSADAACGVGTAGVPQGRQRAVSGQRQSSTSVAISATAAEATEMSPRSALRASSLQRPSVPPAVEVVAPLVSAVTAVASLVHKVWVTVSAPSIAGPALFVFLWQACPAPTTAMFYFQTEVLGFSPQFQEVVYLCGSLAAFAGVLLYQVFLVNKPIKTLLLWCALLGSALNATQLILVSRLNVWLGLSDKLFVLGDYAMLSTLAEVMMTPMLALSARVCPDGAEATLYATLYSVINLSTAVSTGLGSALTSLFGVTATDFRNITWLVLACNLTMLLPLPVLWFITDDSASQPGRPSSGMAAVAAGGAATASGGGGGLSRGHSLALGAPSMQLSLGRSSMCPSPSAMAATAAGGQSRRFSDQDGGGAMQLANIGLSGGLANSDNLLIGWNFGSRQGSSIIAGFSRQPSGVGFDELSAPQQSGTIATVAEDAVLLPETDCAHVSLRSGDGGVGNHFARNSMGRRLYAADQTSPSCLHSPLLTSQTDLEEYGSAGGGDGLPDGDDETSIRDASDTGEGLEGWTRMLSASSNRVPRMQRNSCSSVSASQVAADPAVGNISSWSCLPLQDDATAQLDDAAEHQLGDAGATYSMDAEAKPPIQLMTRGSRLLGMGAIGGVAGAGVGVSPFARLARALTNPRSSTGSGAVDLAAAAATAEAELMQQQQLENAAEEQGMRGQEEDDYTNVCAQDCNWGPTWTTSIPHHQSVDGKTPSAFDAAPTALITVPVLHLMQQSPSSRPSGAFANVHAQDTGHDQPGLHLVDTSFGSLFEHGWHGPPLPGQAPDRQLTNPTNSLA